MKYPYYIVEWSEGRMASCIPLEFKHTPVEKMLKSGRIGGRRRCEMTFSDLGLARVEFNRHRSEQESLLVIEAPNRPRKRIHDPITYFRVHAPGV